LLIKIHVVHPGKLNNRNGKDGQEREHSQIREIGLSFYLSTAVVKTRDEKCNEELAERNTNAAENTVENISATIG